MTTIITKNSSTAGAAPTAGDLVQGELAVNVTDKRLYTENASGTVVELGTNPSVPVTFPDGSASAPSLTNDGDTNTGVYFPAADTVGITTGGTERVRVDSSGNVGIGTSSPSYRLDVQGNGDVYAHVRNNTSGSGAARLLLTNNGDSGFGIINNSGASGVVNLLNYKAAPMAFWTDSAERMRIDTSGNLLVNNTSGSVSGPGTGQAVIACSTSGKFALAITNTNASGAYGLGINSQTGENIYFYYQGTYKGLVSTSAGGTTYGTTSDYRLKENVQPMLGALEKVSQLKPCTYVWKEDGSFGQGFIAHELAEVCQQAVVGEKDAVDENGNPKYQSIDTSFLVATLTAAIQELKATVDAQAARITALEQA